MPQTDNTAFDFDQLFTKIIDVRVAQKTYYAYRPRSERDMDRKAELLDTAKDKEKELDKLLKEISEKKKAIAEQEKIAEQKRQKPELFP